MSRIKLKTLSNLLPVSKITKPSSVSKAPAVINKRQLSGNKLQAKRHELWVKAGGKCAMCGEVVTEYHLDHITPIHQGGTDEDENLQILCIEPCHLKKTKSEMSDIGKKWEGKYF